MRGDSRRTAPEIAELDVKPLVVSDAGAVAVDARGLVTWGDEHCSARSPDDHPGGSG
jgi:hypothetical protein